MFGIKRLEKRIAELESIQQGGCNHIWRLSWVGGEGNRYVEKCAAPTCTAWRGSI